MRALRNTGIRNVNSKGGKKQQILQLDLLRVPCVQPIMQKSNKLIDCGSISADVQQQQQQQRHQQQQQQIAKR